MDEGLSENEVTREEEARAGDEFKVIAREQNEVAVSEITRL
jgi:hypothetical protein